MRSIWAVARVTIREALRQKSATAMLVLLAVVLPVLGFTVSGDATLPGRAQMFLDWSLRMSRLLLGLMTVFVACGTIAWELKYKQAYITLVKPIPRWQFLVGKWVGIALLNAALLVVVGLVIEGFTWQFRGRPGLGYDKQSGLYWKLDKVPLKGLTEEQRQFEQREREILNREVLVARQALSPVPPDDQIEKDVESTFERMNNTGERPRGLTDGELKAQIRDRKKMEYATVEPFKEREFRFTHLSTARRKGGYIQIRYMIQPGNSTPNNVMSYLWRIGDPRKGDVQVQYVPCRNEPVRTLHTIRVGSEAISDDGELLVTFANVDPYNPKQSWGASAIFSGLGSMEVLYPVGSFEGNLSRALAMVLVQMVFLAALGLLGASFLTFPTACLTCLLVFAASGGVKYLQESMDWTYKDTSSVVSHQVTLLTGPGVRMFLKSIPDFGEYNPSEAIVDGKVVAWSFGISPSLSWALVDVGIRTGLVLLVGCWVLTRREVAQVVV